MAPGSPHRGGYRPAMSEQENEQVHDQDSEPSLNAPGDAPPSGITDEDSESEAAGGESDDEGDC